MNQQVEDAPASQLLPGDPKNPACKVRMLRGAPPERALCIPGTLREDPGLDQTRAAWAHPAPPGGLSRDPRHPKGAPGPRPRAKPRAPQLAGTGSRQGAAREVPTLSSRHSVPALELAGPQLGPPVQQCRGEDARGGSRWRVASTWPPGAAGKLWPWGRQTARSDPGLSRLCLLLSAGLRVRRQSGKAAAEGGGGAGGGTEGGDCARGGERGGWRGGVGGGDGVIAVGPRHGDATHLGQAGAHLGAGSWRNAAAPGSLHPAPFPCPAPLRPLPARGGL